MTTFCSYDTTSLFSLRPQAIPSQLLRFRCASAEQLNLWVPTAQQNERGHTQPFPFHNYIHGIGKIVTTSDHITKIFAEMSWDAPSEEPWGVAEAQPESSIEQNMVSTISDAAAADTVTADELSNGVTDETFANAAPAPDTESRKSSLAGLANGDRSAAIANLGKGFGPHKLLSRFASTSQNSDAESKGAVPMIDGHAPDTELSEPDGAASVVDDSTSIASTTVVATKKESTQTAPDTDASKLFKATPASSVTDGDKSVIQSPDISPRTMRKTPGPHHRLKALTQAQDVPLPQSPAPAAKSITSDEGPTTPIASGIQLEPVIIQDTPPAPPVTIADGNESDTSCVIITEFPNSLSEKEKNLDPKAEAWIPDEVVDPLPPSRPVSSTNSTKHITHDSEAVSINECCPVPGDWSMPTKTESSTDSYLLKGPTVGDVHKTALAHYSHYFATAFASETSVNEEDLDRVLRDPFFEVLHGWIYGQHKLRFTTSNGVTQHNQNIDLKVLVQLWRFAARIQAPIFANTVADVIVKKAITADDILNAADEIDALLQMISVNNTFRLLISHMVIVGGIQLDHAAYETWPKSLIWSILNCLEMGKRTPPVIQLYSQTHPCIYHLHSLGRTCMSK